MMPQTSIETAIQTVLAAASARETIETIYFVACGGSFAQMHLPHYAVDREATTISAESLNSAEFMAP